jgi:phosphoribosylformimino-5-aminoimidazole carboxamide ribotide isomerase
MLLIPAIDLMGGEVVRLEKGDFASRRAYAGKPAERAAEFAAAGATLVHVVDLDGAKMGWPVNVDAVAAICRVPGLTIELGGGLRTLPDIEQVLKLGVRQVVLGTAAVERMELLEKACKIFRGRVRAAIDARDGEVEVAGWTSGTGLQVVDVARRVKAAGVSLVEYTDVGRAGRVEVIASGGVASLADVVACREAGLAGVIVGKALYEGRFSLADALAAARGT